MRDCNICIGTGWYADHKGHNNPQRSALQISPEWFSKYWVPNILKYINPMQFHFYLSNCEILPSGIYGMERTQIVMGHVQAVKMAHSHDCHAAIMTGAMYAWCNNLDYLFIEQDCMVKGLDKILDFAKDKDLCYGFGEYSYLPGWAEYSLIYVDHADLIGFISNFIHSPIINMIMPDWPEVEFQRLFGYDFTAWPFGYGRKRPIDFNQPMCYAQQLTDNEIAKFMEADANP